MSTADPTLRHVRGWIDRIDAAQLVLLALRTRLAGVAAEQKRRSARPLRDIGREQAVKRRCERIALRLGVHPRAAGVLVDVAIAEAHRAQGLAPDLGQGRAEPGPDIMSPTMDIDSPGHGMHAALLRCFPPPARWAPVLAALPAGLQARWMDRAMARVLAGPCRQGMLDFLHGRRLGVEVADLGLRWVVTFDRGRLCTVAGDAEAVVRGDAADLLALAGRLEDADRLFFQRRLVLTGDTELGLTARNLLDALPWDEIPLGLRVLLNRGARVAREARAAYQDGTRGTRRDADKPRQGIPTDRNPSRNGAHE